MTLIKPNIVNSVKGQIGFTRKKSVETVETLLEIIKKPLNQEKTF